MAPGSVRAKVPSRSVASGSDVFPKNLLKIWRAARRAACFDRYFVTRFKVRLGFPACGTPKGILDRFKEERRFSIGLDTGPRWEVELPDSEAQPPLG